MEPATPAAALSAAASAQSQAPKKPVHLKASELLQCKIFLDIQPPQAAAEIEHALLEQISKHTQVLYSHFGSGTFSRIFLIEMFVLCSTNFCLPLLGDFNQF